ncbi:hypothetical protein GN958_ATG16381, partial [Phytophthora infestans]
TTTIHSLPPTLFLPFALVCQSFAPLVFGFHRMEMYELILSRVGRDERQRSCNSVAEDEILALHQAVTKAAATFAKVEEVRDAMKQLQQGNVLTGGSESLIREMENTIKLQRKLEKAMEMALITHLRRGRAKCQVAAVLEELHQAETQLRPGLEALRRALTVAQVSSSICKSASLRRVNELNQELGATELSNAQPLAQFGQPNVDLSRGSEEMKSEGMMEEKNDTTRRGNEEIEETGMRAFSIANRLREFRPLAAHIDGNSSPGFAYWIYGRAMSLISGEMMQQDMVTYADNAMNKLLGAFSTAVNAVSRLMHFPDQQRSRKSLTILCEKKQKPEEERSSDPTSPPVAKRPARDAGCRLQTAYRATFSWFYTRATGNSSECCGRPKRHDSLSRQGNLVKKFVTAVAEAAFVLKDDLASHKSRKVFENMEFVAVSNLTGLNHDYRNLSMFLLSSQSVLNGTGLPQAEPRKYLLQIYEIFADKADSFRTRLLSILQHFEDAATTLPDGAINKDMTSNCDVGGLSIGKLLAKAQQFGSKQNGAKWDQYFIVICRSCKPSIAICRSWGELRLTDVAIINDSFACEEQARDATKSSKKIGTVGEMNLAFLPFEMLALTLKICLNVEKLVCIVRELTYMREDYATIYVY